jgi:mRNA-degrading endonuclease RelE of RelBE toxin-antitoxin system
MFKVEAKRRALKALEKLSLEEKERIEEVILTLKMILYLLGSLILLNLKGMKTYTASGLEI